jgi:hypothetical protein
MVSVRVIQRICKMISKQRRLRISNVFYCNYNSFTFIVSLRKQYVQVSMQRARLAFNLSQNIGDGSGHIGYEIRINP